MKQIVPRIMSIVGAFGMLALNMQAGPIVNLLYTGSFPANITGTLPNQGTALEEAFTLPSTSNVTITTTSYANGGFEPNLFLYNSAGNFVTAGSPFGVPDRATGIVGDMRLTAPNLPGGMYTVALTDFLLNQSLTATNLSAGFTVNYGSGTTFSDSNGNSRTGNYAFTIAGPSSSPVPEPGTMWLAGSVLALLAVKARKRLS